MNLHRCFFIETEIVFRNAFAAERFDDVSKNEKFKFIITRNLSAKEKNLLTVIRYGCLFSNEMNIQSMKSGKKNNE